MIAGFKENRTPSRIDRTVLGKFSGIVGSQLITALRFLGLIDTSNHPKDALRNLIESSGSSKWPEHLESVLKAAYAPLFELNLEQASPGQFSEKFAKTFSGEGSTARKSVAFFLAAAVDAKIPISTYVLKNKKPRSGPSKRRAKSGLRPAADSDPHVRDPALDAAKHRVNPNDQTKHPQSIATQLLEKFPAFDPSWNEDLQSKWFDGYQRLLAMGENK